MAKHGVVFRSIVPSHWNSTKHWARVSMSHHWRIRGVLWVVIAATITVSGCSRFGYGTSPHQESVRASRFSWSYPLSIYRDVTVSPTSGFQGAASTLPQVPAESAPLPPQPPIMGKLSKDLPAKDDPLPVIQPASFNDTEHSEDDLCSRHRFPYIERLPQVQ